jgi:hypothetical protein
MLQMVNVAADRHLFCRMTAAAARAAPLTARREFMIVAGVARDEPLSRP